jgi:hypothetical protein
MPMNRSTPAICASVAPLPWLFIARTCWSMMASCNSGEDRITY